MGFVDAFSAEDRIQVPYSTFVNLVEGKVKAELYKNAVKNCVPYEYIDMILGGEIPINTVQQDSDN